MLVELWPIDRPKDYPKNARKTPISAAGDLWVLGDHKLLVGDATNHADAARLMVGAPVDLIFTDPPYNVSYEGYTEERLTIKGDRMSDAGFKQFLEAAFRSYRAVVKPGASLYVCHSSSWQREFQNALEAAGFEVRCQIIWAKNTFAWGFGRGTGTRPNRLCGKKGSLRQIASIRRLSQSNWWNALSWTAARLETSLRTFSAAQAAH